MNKRTREGAEYRGALKALLPMRERLGGAPLPMLTAIRTSKAELGRYCTKAGQDEAARRKTYTINRRVAVRTWDGDTKATLYVDGTAVTLDTFSRRALAAILLKG